MLISKTFPKLFFETYNWENRIEYSNFKDKKSEDHISNEMWADFMIEKQNTQKKTKSIKQLIFENLNLLYSINRRKRLLTFDESTTLN